MSQPSEPKTAKQQRREHRVGVAAMIGCAACFSVMSLLVKLASQTLPAHEIVFARTVVTLLLSLSLVWRAGVPILGNRRGILFLRGLLGFAGLICFFIAIERLSLFEASVLHYLNPLFTAVLSACFLSELLGRRLIFGLILGFCGVLAVAWPSALHSGAEATGGLDPLGLTLGLVGSLCAAAAYVCVRKLRTSEHPSVIVLYFPMVSLPLTLPLFAFEWVWPLGQEWALLLGVGISAQLAQILLTKGVRLLPAAQATGIGYLQLVFALGWSVLWLHEPWELQATIGAILIAGSALLVARRRGKVGSR